VGSPRWRRKRATLLGLVTSAMSLMRPEHLGQVSTSMAKVRLRSSAQGRYRERWVGDLGLAECFAWAGWSGEAGGGGGTTSGRSLEAEPSTPECGCGRPEACPPRPRCPGWAAGGRRGYQRRRERRPRRGGWRAGPVILGPSPSSRFSGLPRTVRAGQSRQPPGLGSWFTATSARRDRGQRPRVAVATSCHWRCTALGARSSA
jgi:hypothetical protein